MNRNAKLPDDLGTSVLGKVDDENSFVSSNRCPVFDEADVLYSAVQAIDSSKFLYAQFRINPTDSIVARGPNAAENIDEKTVDCDVGQTIGTSNNLNESAFWRKPEKSVIVH